MNWMLYFVFRPETHHKCNRAFWAAATKGSMTYAYTHMGNFLLLFLAIGIWASKLGFGLGFETGIWASRLGYGPPGWGRRGAEEEEEEEKEEKIPHMCESIGHRPLWGCCPARISISATTYLSRARVPLTI